MRHLIPAALFALSVIALAAYSERDAFAALSVETGPTYSLVQYVEQADGVHAYVDDYGLSAADCLSAQTRGDLRCEPEEAAL